MMYSPEQKEEHKVLVATALVLNPAYGCRKIAEVINETKQLSLSKEYVLDLMNEVRQDRIKRYVDEGKEEAMAVFEELVNFIIIQCRKILQEEMLVFGDDKKSIKSRIIAQANRIKALDLMLQSGEKMMNLKMDLGIFERHLGKFESEHKVFHMMGMLRQYRQTGTIIPLEELQNGEVTQPLVEQS